MSNPGSESSVALFHQSHFDWTKQRARTRPTPKIESQTSGRPLVRDSLRHRCCEIDSLSYALPYFLQPRPGIGTVNYAP